MSEKSLEKYCKHESSEGICQAVRSISQCPYEENEKTECEHYDPLFEEKV